jgi:hypothetical protein
VLERSSDFDFHCIFSYIKELQPCPPLILKLLVDVLQIAPDLQVSRMRIRPSNIEGMQPQLRVQLAFARLVENGYLNAATISPRIHLDDPESMGLWFVALDLDNLTRDDPGHRSINAVVYVAMR